MAYKNKQTAGNFTFIRLFFSVVVITAHSYTLSGREFADWIGRQSNGQTNIGWLCFKCFFVISGFLIFQSLIASKSIVDFLWKRILRIYPALFTVLLLTILYGQFVYQYDIPYLQNRYVLSYIPNNLFLFNMQYGIPGIFDKNPYPSAINGSLWSLPYEAAFYIALSTCFLLRKRLITSKVLLFVAYILLSLGSIFYSEAAWNYRLFNLIGTYTLDLGALFVAGALLGSFRFGDFRYKNVAMAGGFALLILSFYSSSFRIFQYISLPLIIIPLGTASTIFIRNTDKVVGDISYGMYIYSFPVQQTLVYYFKLNYLELMMSSLAISFVLGYSSWHLIEKHAMKLKKFRFQELPPAFVAK